VFFVSEADHKISLKYSENHIDNQKRNDEFIVGGSILLLYTKSITTDPAILTNILSKVTDINFCLSLAYSDLYKKKYKNILITANIAML
jgi:hypothetical protein